MSTDLSGYVPDVLSRINEISALLSSENPEFDLLSSERGRITEGQYADTADEDFIKRWETMTGTTPKAGDTLDVRRLCVLSRLAVPDGYTERKLKKMIDGILGEGAISFSIDYTNCILWLSVHRIDPAGIDILYRMIEDTIPANMDIGTSLEATLAASADSITIADEADRTGTIPGRAALSVDTGFFGNYAMSGSAASDEARRTSKKIFTGTIPETTTVSIVSDLGQSCSASAFINDDESDRTGRKYAKKQ